MCARVIYHDSRLMLNSLWVVAWLRAYVLFKESRSGIPRFLGGGHSVKYLLPLPMLEGPLRRALSQSEIQVILQIYPKSQSLPQPLNPGD